MNFSHRKTAFTLIELLVVIAIIAILAAILFPVFAQAKESAKGTQSLSNLKQLGTSLSMYLADFDDTFHDGWDMNVSGGNGFAAHNDVDSWTEWPWFYGPYIKSAQMFDCPLSPDPVRFDSANWDADGNYGWNYDGLSRDVNNSPRVGTELPEPAGTYAFFTSGDSAVRPGTNNYSGLLEDLDVNLTCDSNRWNAYNRENAFRYRKKAIVVFTDSHVNTVHYSVFVDRKADNVAPWMIEWTDCNPTCPRPVYGPGQCFDPSRLP